MWKILYLPNAEEWPDSKLRFPTKEIAQAYLDFRFSLGITANVKHLYEVVEAQ
jgi:hypothetical protein